MISTKLFEILAGNPILKRRFSKTQSRHLKLVQFTYEKCPDLPKVGYLDGDYVIDLNAADACLPNTLVACLRNNEEFWKRVCCIREYSALKFSRRLRDVCLKAPITGMDKILCVGLNYMDHCCAHNIEPPCVPMIFGKFASTVIGPNEPLLIRSGITQKVDWEIELCVVMGRPASMVKACNAYNYVLGCTIAQDISARDWQKDENGGQFLLGKSMDTFCPLGPWIVTLDEIGDPGCLEMACILNGRCKQVSNTCEMIFKIPQLIERISSVMTLLPGDIILTGTPAGVGIYSDPPEFLRPGDILRSEIQNIGYMQHRVLNYCC